MPSFLDTNILVYAEDRQAGDKRRVARDLVLRLWDDEDGVLSIQVLQEFYVTVTRKMRRPMSPRAAREIVEQYLHWKVVENSGSLLLAAIVLSASHRLSFWDALVVQAAIAAGCERLYSEDLQHGRKFGRLEIINPFL